jgi:hypothetical protein
VTRIALGLPSSGSATLIAVGFEMKWRGTTG